MAPQTPERTAFEKNRCTDTGAIVQTKPTDIKYDRLHLCRIEIKQKDDSEELLKKRGKYHSIRHS